MKIKTHYLKALKYLGIVCLLFSVTQVYSQDQKTRIKIEKIEDGKTISVDTILINPSQEEIDGVIKSHDTWTNQEGNTNIRIDIEGAHENERIIIGEDHKGGTNIWVNDDGKTTHLKGNNFMFIDKDVPKTYLGIMMKQTVNVEHENGKVIETSGQNGVVVDEVMEDSPAAKANIIANDIIKRIDNQVIDNGETLLAYLAEKNPGDVVEVQVERNGQIKNIGVTLEERKMMPNRMQHFEFKEGYGPNEFKERKMHRVHGNKAFLGINLGQKIEIENINGEEMITHSSESDVQGALVSGLVDDGPAEQAGLLEKDVIVAMDGKTIKSDEELLDFLSEKKPNDVVKVTVNRNGKKKKINVTLGTNDHVFHKGSNEMIFEIEDIQGDMPEIMKIWQDEDGQVKGMHQGEMIFLSNDDGEMVHEFEIETNEDGKIVRKHLIVNVRVADLEEKDIAQLDHPSFKIENSLQLERLVFYPNPNSGAFNLSFTTEEQGDLDILVTDMSGKEMYRESLTNFTGDYDKRIDLPEISSGLYIVQIQQNGKVVNKKLVIQQ